MAPHDQIHREGGYTMLKLKSLTEDQMFFAALVYETSGCDIPMEEFLQKVLARYEEIYKLRQKTPTSPARIGKLSDLGL